MAEGFRFMPFGFSQAKNLSAHCMGYLGETLTQVFTRVRGRSEPFSQRCHNSPRWETGQASANDVMHRKRAEDFGKFEES